MHPHRQPASPSGQIITKERPLPPLIQLPLRRQRQWTRWNHQPSLQGLMGLRIQNFPSRDSKCVGFPSNGPPRITQSATHSISCSALTRGDPNILDANRASLSNAVAASAPLNRGVLPMICPNCSHTALTRKVSNPVTFSINGGQATRPNVCKII